MLKSENLKLHIGINSNVENSNKHFIFVDCDNIIPNKRTITTIAKKYNLTNIQVWVSSIHNNKSHYWVTCFEGLPFIEVIKIAKLLRADKRFINCALRNDYMTLRVSRKNIIPRILFDYRFEVKGYYYSTYNYEAYHSFKMLINSNIDKKQCMRILQ